MKRNRMKMLSTFLVLALTVTLGSSAAQITAAKKKAVSLSAKSITLNVGKKKVIKIKNTTKKVKWSIKKGSKFISLSNKKAKRVTVIGKKAGSAVVVAKVAKKSLTCKVTVKSTATKSENKNVKSTATPTQTPTTAPTTAPTQAPTAAPTNAPTAVPSAIPTIVPASPGVTPTPFVGEAVPDITIDLSKYTTVFTEQGAKINFSDQINDKFDLRFYKSVVIGYKCTFEGNDTSKWNCGKIGLANSAENLNGYDDGVKNNDYSMSATGTETTIDLSGDGFEGTVLGINIQPMDSDFGWPAGLTSVEITSIKFVAREGATYPDPSAPATPTPIPLPTYAPETFSYEGLDTSWIDPSKPMVAFTFDDGPCGISGSALTADQMKNSKYSTSDRIENILHTNNAHATFFCIGKKITEDTRAEVARMKEWGFEVGNHSWDYASLSSSKADAVMKSVEDTNTVLKEITGYNNFLFRAPNLSISKTMLGYIKAPFINCAVDSRDWAKATVDEIIENVQKAKDGDVVLMHGTEENTAQAVSQLIEYFHNKGWQIVSVSEMFAVKSKALMTGTAYSNAN